MKKTVVFFVCCLWGLLCYAQQEDRQNNQNHTDSIQPEEHDVRTYEMWKHKKYFRVGYVNQSVTSASGSDMQSRFGIDLLKGRSFFLHKKPIAGLMKFAIDFGVYLNYTMYRDDVATTESGGSDGYQEGEQAGEKIAHEKPSFLCRWCAPGTSLSQAGAGCKAEVGRAEAPFCQAQKSRVVEHGEAALAGCPVLYSL